MSEPAPERASVFQRRSGRLVVLGALFVAAGLALYRPALDGPLFSDDLFYLQFNPYVTDPSPSRLLELLDPRGEAVTLTFNYAPMHLALHAASVKLFGPRIRAYHALNVVLHAIASVLLAALLLRSGLPEPAAAFGAAFFLVHPANVEAVAWVFQLKTSASFVFALLALLALERRPKLATLAFALGLLTKPTAAFALPVALVWTWTRRGAHDSPRRGGSPSWGWLILWSVLLAAFAMAEFQAFAHATSHVEPIHPDPWVRFRTSVGFGMRYLAMGATSFGISPYHEPQPALSVLDPWWLGGLAAGLMLGARTVWTLKRRREEAGWWVWAAVSFLPVSQIFPFPFPLADRYLYPILAGLIGGALLAAAPWVRRIATQRSTAQLALAGLALATLVLMGARSASLTRIWRFPVLLQAEAARNYPDGVSASLVGARRAVEEGNHPEALAKLRSAHERQFIRLDQILGDPIFAPLHGTDAWNALVRDMAGTVIQGIGELEAPSQGELIALARAHRLRGETDEARRAFERALAEGGPYDEIIRGELARMER